MSKTLRKLFVVIVAYPVALVWLGLLVRHRERLPSKGPAIIAVNHNSHLDVLALLCLFPLRVIPVIRPVAAADYFLKNRLIAWFAIEVIGIVPVIRSSKRHTQDPLSACYDALERGEILILFPEGSRGSPEVLTRLKSGIWHLTQHYPDVQVIPVFMHGLGRSMPKGEWFPVPLFVDIFVGRTLEHDDNKSRYMQQLTHRFRNMQATVFPSGKMK